MTKLQAIRWFANQLTKDPVTIGRKRLDGNWGMDLGSCQTTPRLLIPMDLYTIDSSDKVFRKNFVDRCSLAQGFSHATLAILHEYGHWETRSVFNIVAYDKIRLKVTTQEEYMNNPYERIATEWAICWLQDPSNRRIAKQFEKYYFGHD